MTDYAQQSLELACSEVTAGFTAAALTRGVEPAGAGEAPATPAWPTAMAATAARTAPEASAVWT